MTFTYSVGEEKIHDKLQAIKEHSKTAKALHFHCPEEFDTYDFSHEPEQDLDTLLKNEASKIRDKYRTVRLYYSGGSDSRLMLDTFTKNNIHIDEIICIKTGIKEADVEIDNFALPVLKKLNLSKTKITIHCPTKEQYRDFHSMPTTDKISKGMLTWDQQFRLGIQTEFYREDLFGNSICNLHGYDKPKIIKVNGQWYTYFIDVDIEPTEHTYHFFSNNPALQAKQAHLFLSKIKNKTFKENEIWNYQDLWNKSIGRRCKDMPKKILYHGTEDFITHHGEKMYFMNYKEKLALEYAKENLTDILGKWLSTIKDLQDFTNNEWWNYDRPEMGTIGVFSKFYGITTKSVKTVDELFPDGFNA
jgi:hypothetical protein